MHALNQMIMNIMDEVVEVIEGLKPNRSALENMVYYSIGFSDFLQFVTRPLWESQTHNFSISY